MPQGQISPGKANLLMLCLFAATRLISTLVAGGLRQNMALIFLGTWYNNFGGADGHPIMRDAMNALGYMCFASGAMEVSRLTASNKPFWLWSRFRPPPVVRHHRGYNHHDSPYERYV